MVELIVTGMRCGPCGRAVTEAVQSIDPAASVDVNLDNKRVSIESTAKIDDIRTAIEGAGYQVEMAA